MTGTSSPLTSSDLNAMQSRVGHRRLTVEFYVGLFTLLGTLALGYLAVGLGGLALFPSNAYSVKAQFDNISGLKKGASVEIAGVQVGSVTALELKDPEAIITMSIDNQIKLNDDDIVAIRTKGIIGDRYVKISRGGSGNFIEPDGLVVETESVVDIEDLIGKIVHSMTNKDA
jgi:phospholipid/cholesterol/gamma-HCH transport system substrate-binding protein